ncbi:MAG: 2-oxo acid dehydrogenase subunit E2 [Saprospiraceae bacterium]|nr:2-oxo acid dehydrogenase subunit E2 [Saprospiraceae bacterium]
MADFELIMPKMGESIIEATILGWLKKEGDEVDVDETILEIATDKVDSEIPSPVKGVIKKVIFNPDDVVPVGETIALIQTDGDVPLPNQILPEENGKQTMEDTPTETIEPIKESATPDKSPSKRIPPASGNRFYSPLVRKIASEENISLEELEGIAGSGMQDRVTKRDILSYLNERTAARPKQFAEATKQDIPTVKEIELETLSSSGIISGQDELMEMDRTRRLIAEHMVHSRRISAHVTSFVEVDVTNIVQWREMYKDAFLDQHQTKLTYTPIFMQAVVKAIRDFPLINASLQDNKIIIRKKVNIGMATAVPDGHLIVPIIKQADNYSLVGLANKVNDLAERARTGKLNPEEIQDGTFTITNVGTFGNVMGTPIINQPQVAILAIGAIRKKPAVVETSYGDLIAIRHMMFLSLSYDHRIIDGFLGGSFLKRIADYLEQFEDDDTIS